MGTRPLSRIRLRFQEISASPLLRSRGINRLADLRNLGCRKSTEFRVPKDNRLVFSQIHAERLVGSNKGFVPLDIRCQLTQCLVGLGRGFSYLYPLQSADFRNISLD